MGRDHKHNTERADSPRPGDYWHEMFCPYFIVMALDDDGRIIICDDKRTVDDGHWTFDLHRCKRITMQELRRRVTYSSKPTAFVADCSAEPHEWVKDARFTVLEVTEPTFADLYQ